MTRWLLLTMVLGTTAHALDEGGQLALEGESATSTVPDTSKSREVLTDNIVFREALHSERSRFADRGSLGVDGTFFTDRARSPVVPSELDATGELPLHAAPIEVHPAYERDGSLDEHGLVQHFVDAVVAVKFELREFPAAFGRRHKVGAP